MKFKVVITCKQCDCCFELSPGSFKLRDSYECPNCGQPLPADIYESIKTGIVSLGKVPGKYPKTEGFESVFARTGFEFAVKEPAPTTTFADLVSDD